VWLALRIEPSNHVSGPGSQRPSVHLHMYWIRIRPESSSLVLLRTIVYTDTVIIINFIFKLISYN
jgi:hypothetical protein